MPLPAGGHAAGASSKFLASTRYEESPAWSPDGKRVAFSSNRGGVRQIWVAEADGSNAVALTNFPDGIAGSPRWSPDGDMIVFDARPNGAADVYSVRADGGIPKRLTDHPAEDHVPCYSADGRWIYFASLRSGPGQVYRMPATGGEAVQVTRKGAYAPIASPDGKWIYYEKENGIWKVPPDGGEEVQVLEAGSLLGASRLELLCHRLRHLFRGTGPRVKDAATDGIASRTVSQKSSGNLTSLRLCTSASPPMRSGCSIRSLISRWMS
jgi:Tol biopolymer transport system component